MTMDVTSSANRPLLISGAVVGLVYGLVVRLGMASKHNWGGVMTAAFLFGVPFVMGFLTIFVVERKRQISIPMWILLPWLTVLAGAVGTAVTFLEGTICIVMFLPVGLVCASTGGMIAGVIMRLVKSRMHNGAIMGCVLFLPLFIGPFERGVLLRTEVHETQTTIDIHAPAEVVWRNIERVPKIAPEELPPSWSRRIGFPNPEEATLSYEGVGGVRHATFSGGVLFIENIDVWEPQKRLGFSIHAQGDQIPATTLDEHVRVGGEYFDVLRGEYKLESLPGGVIRLHLLSQQKVSTDFNWYARAWSDAIMRDLQNRILLVIQRRAEARR